ncbi:hypothetical protein GGX14DRAFT_402280 [Mycena pura]|uniref:Uncharacterized protein n=1 Tax=Mycena pura TaxID=153505 RepID=A0AAD6Y9L4_9AGAR|nr:hypothetical protein GGX14DRAFT_402280 [Mycena pura]
MHATPRNTFGADNDFNDESDIPVDMVINHVMARVPNFPAGFALAEDGSIVRNGVAEDAELDIVVDDFPLSTSLVAGSPRSARSEKKIDSGVYTRTDRRIWSATVAGERMHSRAGNGARMTSASGRRATLVTKATAAYAARGAAARRESRMEAPDLSYGRATAKAGEAVGGGSKGQHFREKRNRTQFFNLAEGRGTNQPPILTMPGTGWGHSQIFFAEYTTLSQRVWTQIMAALQRFARPAPDERYALQDSNFSEHQRCAKENVSHYVDLMY